jgi:hypothetical protein
MMSEITADTEVVLSQELLSASKVSTSTSNLSAMDDAALEAMLNGLPRQSDFH